ncbi:MAG: hypothetical protein HY925_14695, partial [Elusimicrobia bacterium]|nr:hypothetical protein [Elusimicrobiota bacterium]
MRLFAKLAAAALLPLVAAVVALLARPDLVVNSRTAAWALRRFGAAYSPEWRALNLSVSSRSFLDKTVALDADGFCVRGSSPPWSACFERVRARVDVLFGPGGLEEAYVRLLDVEGGPVRADLSRKYASVPKKPRSSPPEWPAWLKLGRIEIALPDNRVRL